MTNRIDSTFLLSSYQESKRKMPSNNLGKDDFLNLLMAQLQNQDPTNPMQDTDFIAQMAQFSSLEQMTNINNTIKTFVDQQQQTGLITYNQFIGKEITWHKVTEQDDGSTAIVEGNGRVKGLQYKDNQILFILEDGTQLEPGNISLVKESVSDSSMMQASTMIGKKVTYLNEEKEEFSAIVSSVSFKNGKISFALNDAGNSTISQSQIIKIE